jgi:DNA-binding transcriptional regulator YhcF (GntR family)
VVIDQLGMLFSKKTITRNELFPSFQTIITKFYTNLAHKTLSSILNYPVTMWKFNPEFNSKLPKYRQIIAAIINDIEKGSLKKDEQLPSINELSFEYDIARDTVEKAYNELKEKNIISSVRGKGFFVNGLKGSKLRILLILNKLSAYKKLIYYSFINTLGDKATVDLHVHHYNAVLLKNILSENKGKYHYYVVMPHFFDGTANVDIIKELEAIPKDELVLLDKNLPELKGNYLCVYQDFENDIYEALESGEDAIAKYKELCLLFPENDNHPNEIVRGFRKFCSHYDKQYQVVENADNLKLKKGSLYIVIAETSLVNLVKQAMMRGLELGKDIGILSFNETTLKEILAGGIATISTHFEAMGSTAATLILERQTIKIKNPFSLIRRPSL